MVAFSLPLTAQYLPNHPKVRPKQTVQKGEQDFGTPCQTRRFHLAEYEWMCLGLLPLGGRYLTKKGQVLGCPLCMFCEVVEVVLEVRGLLEAGRWGVPGFIYLSPLAGTESSHIAPAEPWTGMADLRKAFRT